MIEVVSFDAAGTLIRFIPSFPELFARVCCGRGAQITAEQVARAQERLGGRLMDLAPRAGLKGGITASPENSRRFWTFAYRTLLEELGLGSSRLESELYETLSDPVCYGLFEDARPALEQLAGCGLRLGIISNFDDWLEEILYRQGVRDFFETVVVSAFEGVEKPEPEIYRRTLARLRVDPRCVLHVGDFLDHDVMPARKAGMLAILLDRFGRHPRSNPRLTSLSELPGWIRLCR